MNMPRTAVAVLAIVLLAAACTTGDDGVATPTGTGGTAASPAAPGATGTPGDTPQPTGPTAQELLVAPQEPLERQASEREVGADERGRATLDVLGTADGGELPEGVGLALFSCADVRLGPPEVFTDSDGDGVADGIGSTETGAAFIEEVNGAPLDEAGDTWPLAVTPQDGTVSVTLNSFDPDCAVVVAMVDEDGDGGLAVGADGVPTEPFGLGRVSWIRGS